MISANILAFYCVGEEVYCHAHASKNVDSVSAGRDEVARRGKGIILEDVAASEGESFSAIAEERNEAEDNSVCDEGPERLIADRLRISRLSYGEPQEEDE